MRQKNKTIILGGAFDPPHVEHINIVINALAELHAEKIILTPSWNSPHKTLSTPFEDRVNMLKNLFRAYEQVEIDEIEKEIGGKNYTVLMLPKLLEKYGEFTYLIGGDSLLLLERWYEFKEILAYPLAVVARGADKSKVIAKIAELRAKYSADITLLCYNGKEVSSGYIRGALELREWNAAKNFLTADNIQYIKECGLYQPRNELVEKVFSTLSERLRVHTINTTLTALAINTNLGLPYEKVFLSAFLHDIAKHTECEENMEIPSDAVGTAVQHQYLGARLAEKNYKITDVDILNAIKYHTTSKAGATTLEKLIYCADMLEKNRVFEGVNELRTLAYIDFDECYRQCIIHSYNYLLSQGAEIYPLTTEAYEEVIKQMNK